MNDEVFRKLLGANALEIAGPSNNFSDDGIFPIYSLLAQLDDISYPRPLEWKGRPLNVKIKFDGKRFVSQQFVGDGELQSALPNKKYDCILSSHVIEHLANPLRTLKMWSGLLKKNGLMIHVIPHKETTFDARRPVTSLAHLIEDFKKDTNYNDTAHFEEVRNLSLEHHSEKWFSELPLHRGMHQHVFDTGLCIEIFVYLGMRIIICKPLLPHHILMVVEVNCHANQTAQTLMDFQEVLKSSPFKLDRE